MNHILIHLVCDLFGSFRPIRYLFLALRTATIRCGSALFVEHTPSVLSGSQMEEAGAPSSHALLNHDIEAVETRRNLGPGWLPLQPYYGICILHELMRDILGIVCYRRRLWGFTVYFWVVDVSFDDRR